MKNLLANGGVTFDSMKALYGLQIVSQMGGITAKSAKIPGVTFVFGNYGSDMGKDDGPLTLEYVGAPASLMLPEYVGMSITKIPIYDTQQNGGNVQFSDQYGGYLVASPLKPGILSAGDTVSMSD